MAKSKTSDAAPADEALAGPETAVATDASTDAVPVVEEVSAEAEAAAVEPVAAIAETPAADVEPEPAVEAKPAVEPEPEPTGEPEPEPAVEEQPKRHKVRDWL